jgi:hypothetical protein
MENTNNYIRLAIDNLCETLKIKKFKEYERPESYQTNLKIDQTQVSIYSKKPEPNKPHTVIVELAITDPKYLKKNMRIAHKDIAIKLKDPSDKFELGYAILEEHKIFITHLLDEKTKEIFRIEEEKAKEEQETEKEQEKNTQETFGIQTNIPKLNLTDLDSIIKDINKNKPQLFLKEKLTNLEESKNPLLPGFLVYLKDKANQRILIHLQINQNKEITHLTTYNEKELNPQNTKKTLNIYPIKEFTLPKLFNTNFENPLGITPKIPKQHKTKQELYEELELQRVNNLYNNVIRLQAKLQELRGNAAKSSNEINPENLTELAKATAEEIANKISTEPKLIHDFRQAQNNEKNPISIIKFLKENLPPQKWNELNSTIDKQNKAVIRKQFNKNTK